MVANAMFKLTMFTPYDVACSVQKIIRNTILHQLLTLAPAIPPTAGLYQ